MMIALNIALAGLVFVGIVALLAWAIIADRKDAGRRLANIRREHRAAHARHRHQRATRRTGAPVLSAR